MSYRDVPRPTRVFLALKGCLRAIDASNGKVAWLYKNLPHDGRIDVIPHVTKTGEDRIVVGAAGHLAFLDAETGTELWAVDAPRAFAIAAVDEGIIIVGDGEMRCLSFTGEWTWRRPIAGARDVAPVVEPRLPFTLVTE